MPRRYRLIPLLLLLVVLASASSVVAQSQAEKRPLKMEDYGLWRSIGSTAISDDGRWVCFNYSRRETDDSLYVKDLQSQKEYLIPLGSNARFSEDSKWVAYSLSEPQSERDREAAQTQPTAPTGPGGRRGGAGGAGRKAGLMNLETGEKHTWENVASFAFSEDSRYFAARKTKADREAEHDGTDLILRHLGEGYEELIGSVSDFAFNKPGKVLLYTVDAADKDGNGLYVIFLETGRRRPLDNGKARYTRMTLDEEGTAVAVLKGNDDEKLEQRPNVLLVFTGLDRSSPARHEYDPAAATDFPEEMVISQLGTIDFNEDATRVFFGIKEQKEEEEVVADVDIWHWNDDEIQSVQMIRAERDRNRTHRAVYHLGSKRFLQLTDDEMRTISITRDGEWGIGQNDRAYISDWEERKADYYRVDIETGERTLMFAGQGRTLGLSPDSRHFLYWQDGHVWDYVIASGEKVNLTRAVS